MYGCPPDPGQVEVSQALQAFWSQVSLDVTLDAKEQSAHITAGIGTQNTPFLRGGYDIQSWRLGSEADPYTLWSSAFGDVDAEVLNVTDFTHPDITANLEPLRLEGDLDTRNRLVEEISLVLAEEMPVLWAGSTVGAIVVEDGVHGVLAPTTAEGITIDGAAETEVWTAVSAAWSRCSIIEVESHIRVPDGTSTTGMAPVHPAASASGWPLGSGPLGTSRHGRSV